jgi:CheY-like chemotaxis protein
MPNSLLVVEDDDELRSIVDALLQSEGYVVRSTATPDEALALLEQASLPCMVLLDAISPHESRALIDRASFEGVHVATIPVSLASTRGGSKDRPLTKRLTSKEAILTVVREHCPLQDADDSPDLGAST